MPASACICHPPNAARCKPSLEISTGASIRPCATSQANDVVRALITKRLCRQANPAWPAGFDVFEMAGPLHRGPRLVVRWRNRRGLWRLLARLGFAWDTTIRVDHRELAFTIGWRRRRLRAIDVANVFVTFDEDDDEGYWLMARDWNGEVHELVEVPSLEHARWLEARIELHLGLHHVREPDEVERIPPGSTMEVSPWTV